MQLNYGIDESYKLSVPTSGNALYAHIEVGTSLTVFSKYFVLSSTDFFKKYKKTSCGVNCLSFAWVDGWLEGGVVQSGFMQATKTHRY